MVSGAVARARLPPGQHVVDDFPALSAGSTPHRPLDEWTFEISGAVDRLLLAPPGALLGAVSVATILAIGNLAVERPSTCSAA